MNSERSGVVPESDCGRERLFLLRLWRDEEGGWRISLKDLGSKRARYFESLATLVAFLKTMVER